MCKYTLMAYSIFHEPWIILIQRWYDGGFNARDISNTMLHLGFETIGMKEKSCHWWWRECLSKCSSRWGNLYPKLCLTWMKYSVSLLLVKLCSALWFSQCREVWFTSMACEGMLFT